MKVNFHKGFFRAWVFVSIIWICSALLIFGTEGNQDSTQLPQKEDFQSAFDFQYEDFFSERRGPNDELLGELYRELIRRNRWPEILFEFPQDVDQSEEGFLTRDILDKSSLIVTFRGHVKSFPAGVSIDVIWSHFYKIEHRKGQIKFLFKLIGKLLIPPFVLFSMGLLTIWVLKGFTSVSDHLTPSDKGVSDKNSKISKRINDNSDEKTRVAKLVNRKKILSAVIEKNESSIIDLIISVLIVCAFYLIQFLMSCSFYNQSIPDHIGEALGALSVLIAIPLIVALIAKLALKRRFFDAFWKALLFFGIPIQLLASYGGYIEYIQK